MARLKLDVDELSNGKLKAVPTAISKLSTGEDNEIFRKTVYDKLVKKDKIEVKKILYKMLMIQKHT